GVPPIKLGLTNTTPLADRLPATVIRSLSVPPVLLLVPLRSRLMPPPLRDKLLPRARVPTVLAPPGTMVPAELTAPLMAPAVPPTPPPSDAPLATVAPPARLPFTRSVPALTVALLLARLPLTTIVPALMVVAPV